MTSSMPERDNVSFVLRLWLEPTSRESSEWRWRVYHVQSGEERYCRTLADVLEFVEGCANVAPPGAW